jgi:hypothetical protein
MGSYSFENYLDYLYSDFMSPEMPPSFNIPDDSTLMKSLINLNFCIVVYIDESYFKENWLFEPYLSNSRSMILYLQQIYGMLLLK